MEKIKQAIEKARQHKPGPAAATQHRPLVPKQRSRGPVAPEAITYSQTAVVAVDPEHLERHRIVAFNKNDPMSVSFDLLRTKVLRKMEDNGWRTLAITSPTAGSGKTVVAINLAMSIAHQTEKTAVLVDMDLRRPKVAEYLGLRPLQSLNQVLSGEAQLHQALYNPGLPRLVILPTGRAEPKPAELLSSSKVERIITELRERYEDRIVLVDLPPVLSTDDVMAIMPQIDCVLVVVANGENTQADVQESLRHLPAVNLVGVVLNKAEVPKGQYY